VGFVGMALKFTEVTLSMIHRNVDDPRNPHGGPMWVARRGFVHWGRAWDRLGRGLAVLFCITLVIATLTGISIFQMWNVANITESYFGVPAIVSALVMAVLVAAVVVGGIRRIGVVAEFLVPFMVLLYLAGGTLLLVLNAGQLPEILASIVRSAFTTHEAAGAFIGGTAGFGFLFGMKRALYSNEAGQGSSPIVHSAARTREPVREGIVAGLEPFIDTIIVCTFTALVILASGVWNRAPELELRAPTAFVAAGSAGLWTMADTAVRPATGEAWTSGRRVYAIARGDPNHATGNDLHRVGGTLLRDDEGLRVHWDPMSSATRPELRDDGLWVDHVGATLTARAFDTAWPGLGKWLVTVACWLFAYSTMISWIYYGEQGAVYLGGPQLATPFRLLVCALMALAGTGFIRTATELDALSTLGTGVMLWVNIPLTLLLSGQAMRAYRDYIRRLDRGEFDAERAG
jgi:AGCS family alanine or glycine:cation symporter